MEEDQDVAKLVKPFSIKFKFIRNAGTKGVS